MTCSVASGHISKDVLKSQIYLCSSAQSCIKEEEKCKEYDRRYDKDLLCDSDGLMHMRIRTT